MEAERKSMDSQGAVSFVVSFNESPKKQRKLPKGLAERRQQRLAKTLLTEESIVEKQKKAQERRKKLTEEKIERLHQLEEEMAGLARKIQAHEKARNAASAIPPPSLSGTKDAGCRGQGASIHVTNGVNH